MRGVFRRAQYVWSLPSNPVASVEKYRQRSSGDIDVFTPEEVLSLVRAASSDQDAAIYLVAAFTGLRPGELLALRWRDVDFAGSVIRVRASYAPGPLTTPKSGRVRSVPMAPTAKPFPTTATKSGAGSALARSARLRPSAAPTPAIDLAALGQVHAATTLTCEGARNSPAPART
jgi:integrase